MSQTRQITMTGHVVGLAVWENWTHGNAPKDGRVIKVMRASGTVERACFRFGQWWRTPRWFRASRLNEDGADKVTHWHA